MPSGHKAFLVQNPTDVDLLLMHNKTFAAEYAFLCGFIYGNDVFFRNYWLIFCVLLGLVTLSRPESELRLSQRQRRWVSKL